MWVSLLLESGAQGGVGIVIKELGSNFLLMGSRLTQASVTWQNRFQVFTGFGSCQGFWKPGKEKSKGLASQGLVNMYILRYLGSRFLKAATHLT